MEAETRVSSGVMTRTMHTTKLCRAMLCALHRNKTSDALQIASILVRRFQTYPRSVSRTVLSAIKSHPGKYNATVRLFDVFYQALPRERRGLLIEQALFMAENGRLTDAVRHLEERISSRAHKNDTYCVGYLGMLQAKIWRDSDKKDDRRLKSALQHLKHSIEMSEYAIEAFVTTYVEILVDTDDWDQIDEVLDEFGLLQPDNPNAHRLAYAMAKHRGFGDKLEQVRMLENIAAIDPTSDDLDDAASLLDSDNDDVMTAALRILMDRAEYSCCGSAWSRLSAGLEQLRAKQHKIVKQPIDFSRPPWQGREWWLSFFFREPSRLDQNKKQVYSIMFGNKKAR